MKIWISGAAGHMGRAVAEAAHDAGAEIAGGIDPAAVQLPFPLWTSFDEAPAGGDVIIDFSRPASLGPLLRYARRNRVPAVLATTGYDEEQLREIEAASAEVPVFRSANMSVGVAVLRKLAREAAAMLGDTYDIEIVEAHHNRKVDAPSGTALMLRDALCADTPHETVYGRRGKDCKRKPGEIGMHALRGGTVAGEHEVCFFGPQERIKLSHSAESRSVFAVGAVKAAAWLIRQPPGLYDMDDLLA